MAFAKCEHSVDEEDESSSSKKQKVDGDDVLDSSEPKPKQLVALNPADSDLDFDIESNGLQGSALYEQGFAYCWSGARSTVGITGGKYCFSCKVISAQPVNMEDTAPDQQNVCRVGISRGDDPVGNLGETDNSFGFGGTSKFSNSAKFYDYGEKFGVGDTIVCAVDLDSKPLASIGFSKNGKWLGTAKCFDAGPEGLDVVEDTGLFPHVLLKNVVVQVQFSVEDGLIPEEGYKPWASAVEDGNAVMGPTFSNPSDCEVMMLVGLPGAGKTTWAESWIKGHPEKRYVLLGTNLVLDQMKVPGLLRKNNYGERFDRLMDRATGIFNTLLSRAARVPRNYILDQTNVYNSARRRKMKPFAFCRKVAVVVFPSPEELKLRNEKRFREMGKEVPVDAVNDMLANYILPVSKDMPGSDEDFDQVIFTEHNRAESQGYLNEMKRALAFSSSSDRKSALTPYPSNTTFHTIPSPQVAAPATGVHWQSSHISTHPHPYPYPYPMSCNYQRPTHVNQYPGMQGPSGVYQVNQYPTPYWNNVDALNAPPYQYPGMQGPSGHARSSAFTYDTHSGLHIRGPRINPQPPRPTSYLPLSPPNLPVRLPLTNTFGSTGGTSASFVPADMLYPGHNAPPRL